VKLALAHDWLDRPIGGAERVLLEMASLYGQAPVHTLLHDAGHYGDRLDSARVRTSWLQSLPAVARRHPRYLLPLIPTAVEQFDLSAFDVVLSSSSAFMKNLVTTPHTLHVCYCHSPMRFVWDYWPAYLDEQRVGPLRRAAIRVLASRLRVWDVAGATRVDVWLANSQTTARRLRKYYGVTARVLYPGIDAGAFHPLAPGLKSDEYLCLATLTPYKKLDLAITAFNTSRRRLVIAGEGPDRARLERLAGPTVRFTGHLGDAARADLLAHSRALVFPSEEDFGIAPLEAMASGTPVVAFGRGGLRESVVAGRTGVFFTEQTPEALNAAVGELEGMELSCEALVARARQFDITAFRRDLATLVDRAFSVHAAGGPR